MFDRLFLFARVFTTVRNWWTYFLRRFGCIKTDLVTYDLARGLSLTLRTRSSDTNVFNDVWLSGVYDVPDFDWKNVRTVLDIGAHVGVFSLYAVSKAPSAKVIAVEPEPSNLELLRKNVSLNHLENQIAVEAFGVAGKPGSLSLNVMPGRGECNSMYRQTEASYRIEVPVTTLTDLFTRHAIDRCDILKMNCEGAEYEIFYSLPDEYFRRISCMLINYHFYSSDPKNHPHVLQAHLEKHGFTVQKNAKNIFIAIRA